MDFKDYYATLGVNKSATEKEIKQAFRKLARKHHPDMNPDDKTAKKKFQEVQKAFDVLSDQNKREMYDRYGSSFESMGRGPGPIRERSSRISARATRSSSSSGARPSQPAGST